MFTLPKKEHILLVYILQVEYGLGLTVWSAAVKMCLFACGIYIG